MSTSWAYIEPVDCSKYISIERMPSPEELEGYASEWSALVSDNTMLRIVVDGSLRSLDEDYFDSALLALFPDEPVKMAAVVGESMMGPLRYHCDLISAWRVNRLIDCLLYTSRCV